MSRILESALDDSTLLTVNNRLAAELRAQYDRSQAAAGRPAWPSADIVPWNAWLQRLYQQLVDSGFTDLDLLTPSQERLLWEDIISADEAGTTLLRPGAAAEAAQSAFALYCEWRLRDQALASLGGDETRCFLRWVRAFERRLSRGRLMSAAQLTPLLTQAVEQRALMLPKRLIRSGFDTLSPGQTALFDALVSSGCEISEQEGDNGQPARQRIQADDGDAEIRMAAQWSLALLQQRPETRIGIVSPRIGQQRQDFERLFIETFNPTGLATGTTEASRFNISLGGPLSECALVAHALLGLRLLTGRRPLQDIGQLLRSPFLGGQSKEWEGRALIDAALREDGLPRLDLTQLIHRAANFTEQDLRRCPDFIMRLQGLQALRHALPSGDTAVNWVGHFQRALGLLGWPGDQPLDSQEFQEYERMQRVFSEFAGLGKVRPRMPLGEAVNRLCTLAAEAVFQPKSPPAPIQILGPLEAAGIGFDAIWLLGLDDQAWPPPPKPNPLLPFGLQRDLAMPHASATRELEFAKVVTARLLQGATVVIASHVRVDSDREQRPSALVHDWPEVGFAQILPVAVEDVRLGFARSAHLEPMPGWDAGTAPVEQPGGAALLAAQASCPFSALARFRLQARPLQEPSHAPDAAQTGNLVHELLQRVWQRLNDSETLAAHDADALRALVAPLASATLDDIGRRRPDLYTTRFRAIEAERLTRLIVDWLDLERSRTQPFRVEALEQGRAVEIGGLRLRTRADRVDRLSDGGLAIIDYKTGRRVSSEGWFDERLTEPQLPLYCLEDCGEVRAALLARVRADERGCGFVGVSRDEGFAPGVEPACNPQGEPDWPALLDHWRQALYVLAEEFHTGHGDPTPSIEACRYCALGALCRVGEMRAGDDDD